MEQFRKFLRGKGFALALAACLLAAAVAGVWAVRTVRARLQEQLDELEGPSAARQQTGTDEGVGRTAQEEDVWQQQTTQAANSLTNVPQSSSAPAVPPASSAPPASSGSPSGAASGSGSVSEPPALRVESEPASSSAAPASTQPVSGRVLKAFSGDELVYNKTLGDWRTHNGVDYACKAGETVCAPVDGKVTEVAEDGNWGPVVSIEDAKGRVWRLCGVASPKVKRGESVRAGQELGKAGSIGCECAEGDHIHLEVKEGQTYLNPVKLLG